MRWSTATEKFQREGIKGLLRTVKHRLPYLLPIIQMEVRRHFHGDSPQKQVWVHIGPHKTGTTYLQRVLVEERYGLRANSIWFDEGSIELGEHLSRESPLTERESQRRRAELHERYRRRPEKVIILSSEGFFGNPNISYGNIKAVAHDVKQLLDGFEAKVISCVRRQDDFLQSWYHQCIKRGETRTFNEYRSTVDFHAFRWDQLLQAYEEQFGRRNLRVLIYERLRQDESRIIETLFGGLGEHLRFVRRKYPRVNPSLSPKGLQLALLCYPHLDLPERKQLRDFLLATFPKRAGEAFSLLSPSECADVMAFYRESNLRLLKSYCGAGSESVLNDEWA